MATTEILVKWSNLDDEEATWEDYEYIRNHFPNFKLEDKLNLEERPLSGLDRRQEMKKTLETVGVLFEFKSGGCRMDSKHKTANGSSKLGPKVKKGKRPVSCCITTLGRIGGKDSHGGSQACEGS
jgi:Chromo (CHRromatin Organisation MOdifier) domain